MPRKKHKSRPLTDRQTTLIGYLEDHWELRGIAPSLAEIGEHFEISRTTARAHILALQKKGYVVLEEGIERSYRPKSIVGRELERRIPIAGEATAGPPICPYEEALGWISVKSTAPRGDLYALYVKGDSMIGAGIMPGDIVVVKKQSFANDGEIVLAMIEDEVTIKRFSRKGDELRLVPENPNHQPIPFDPDRMSIIGKIIEQRRSYE